MYNSEESITYHSLSCDHPLCVSDNNLFKCVNQQIVYDVSYSSGARRKGVASLESFTIRVGNRAYLVQNMLFECFDDTHNPQFERTGELSRIMGFSLSPDSLPSQLMDLIKDDSHIAFPLPLRTCLFPNL